MPEQVTIRVDAVGLSCPIPVVKAKKALEAAAAGSIVDVEVDNETSAQNLIRLGSSRRLKTKRLDLGSGHVSIRFFLPAQDAAGVSADEAAPAASKTVTAVSISSETMGSGDTELGRLLMKGFIYALTQLDVLPDTIVFYNAGAQLSCEGSASLADLKAMEAAGVEILTCGTCLDFYKIKDNLAVGEVTNMYRIVEVLCGADRIVSP